MHAQLEYITRRESWSILIFCASLLFFVACEPLGTEAEFISFEIKDMETEGIFINSNSGIEINFSDEVKDAHNLVAVFELSSGATASVNCGPTSATMAGIWSDSGFSNSVEDARAAYQSSGGWWYISDMTSYFTDEQVPHQVIQLSTNATETEAILLDCLMDGNIMILCLDMYYVTECISREWRVDKFYTTTGADWGHFIVVKGYKMVDGKVYFECYDPFGFGRIYEDGSMKGKNRYYRSKDLAQATKIWWNYALVITDKIKKSLPVRPVDMTGIPNMWGGRYEAHTEVEE